MWRMERHVPCRGGGIASRNKGFCSFCGSSETDKKLGCFGFGATYMVNSTPNCSFPKQGRLGWVLPRREMVDQSAPASILPHKGGYNAQVLSSENKIASSLVREGWDGFQTKEMKLKMRTGANNTSKRVAFTLAEVLITLGIIGVVAAMTMPSLVQNYQKKALETGLKKSYSVLSQAVQRMIEEDGEIPSRASVASTNDNWMAFEKSLSQHLKIVKYCSNSFNGMSDKCISGDSFGSWFGSTYKSYNKKTLGTAGWWFDDGMYVLADGSFLFLDVSVSNDVLLNIDINGSKAPNALGHDVFLFAIDHETGKLRPYGGETKDDTTQKLCDKNSNDGNNGLGCTAKAFENMDEYFKNLP